ncbi:hypothetical protein ACMFMF_003702, partial [Clarireedia jacksonii]
LIKASVALIILYLLLNPLKPINSTFSVLSAEDLIAIPQKEERVAENSVTYRISIRVGDIYSHELTVVLGAITIIGLIIGASAIGWSVTRQLLCNVPPSIIESFFSLILITGHNIGDTQRRVDLYNIYLRRLKLVSYVDTMAKTETLERTEEQDQVDEFVEIEI